MGHKFKIKNSQLGHKITWCIVEAQLGRNLRTDERKVSLGKVGAQLGRTFLISLGQSWGRVSLKVRY